MNKFRKIIASCVYSFQRNLSFFLLESFPNGGALCDIAYAPIRTQSPQKPAAVYRSDPYPL